MACGLVGPLNNCHREVFMLPRKSEQDETTKSHRTPKNLLDYILNQSIECDFIPLLAKHNRSIEALVKKKTENHEIKEAMFVVELNKFGDDLIKIANLCAEINLETRKQRANIENSRKALRGHDSKELAEMLNAFYRDARNYDKNFQIRNWLPKLNGRPFATNLILLFNPFHYNPKLPNEENICGLIAEFNIHENFFINYLNVLYGDGKEGQEFIGKTFEEISSTYKNIKNAVTEISKSIPKSAPERIMKNIQSKHKLLERMLAKYPATLYLATLDILNHLENATTSINSKPSLLYPPV